MSSMPSNIRFNASGGTYKIGCAHPTAKRWEVVLYHLSNNCSIRQTAKANRVSKSSVANYLNLYRSGNLDPKPRSGGRKPILDDDDLTFLKEKIVEQPTLFQDEMKKLLNEPQQDREAKNPSIPTISRFLKKNKITRKKVSVIPSERMKPHVIQRTAEFVSMMENDSRFQSSNLVFLDESHINNRTCWRRYGWSVSGEAVIVERKYARQKGIGLLAAICGKRRGGVVAHTLKEGSYKRTDFLRFLEYQLLPKMRGKVLVMDNCSVHKGDAVRSLCRRFNVDIEFLPAYSPYLNPIESLFSKLKYVLRRMFDREDICRFESIEQALQEISDQDCIGWTRHCGYRMDMHSQRMRRRE
eukprot:TRINITY_DN1325_c0_g1_i14.p1 TRINITY_DN1325_c0_g1~~TRINITY_DN1325_c0_g1_i14.p1  ORF type:complete len:355 (-),score=62.59 TRINITY_DN1325_c0_g1_i14:473-1537(-)